MYFRNILFFLRCLVPSHRYVKLYVIFQSQRSNHFICELSSFTLMMSHLFIGACLPSGLLATNKNWLEKVTFLTLIDLVVLIAIQFFTQL